MFFFCAVNISLSLHELISKTVAYVNRKVKEPGHPLHCDSGVIFGHYSDVLGEQGHFINIHICSGILACII